MAQYDALLLEQLQALWGSGFLSPGGREEVRLIVEGLDLAGKTLLDIGTGLGGPALVLAGECGAQVMGLDVQAEIVGEARQRITAAGLDQQITLQLTSPGPLPLADAEADVVFSKDSLIHVPDKPAIYAEMFRVLRPGGALAISDWLTGPAEDPDVMAFIEASPLDLRAATLDDLLPVIEAAGFTKISTVDRNAWFAATMRAEQAALRGEISERFEAIMGRDAVEAWIARREPIRLAAEAGALRPTHIRARRPDG